MTKLSDNERRALEYLSRHGKHGSYAENLGWALNDFADMDQRRRNASAGGGHRSFAL